MKKKLFRERMEEYAQEHLRGLEMVDEIISSVLEEPVTVKVEEKPKKRGRRKSVKSDK